MWAKIKKCITIRMILTTLRFSIVLHSFRNWKSIFSKAGPMIWMALVSWLHYIMTRTIAQLNSLTCQNSPSKKKRDSKTIRSFMASTTSLISWRFSCLPMISNNRRFEKSWSKRQRGRKKKSRSMKRGKNLIVSSMLENGRAFYMTMTLTRFRWIQVMPQSQSHVIKTSWPKLMWN